MPSSRGMSLVGLLVAMVCLVVLFAISMTALNKAVTGEGSAEEFTVHSTEDKLTLSSLYQSLAVSMFDTGSAYFTPSSLTDERSDDTTANFYSALIAKKYVTPRQLVSANEFSGWVEECYEYDYTAYQPAQGVYWDPAFKADLADLSHVSFAHMPLYGGRFDRKWKATLDSSFPLLGNRGPKDGVDDPTSLTYGRNAQWGGHVVFGDGHVEFLKTFTPPNVTFRRDGTHYADNLFAVEDGMDGKDAILSFTKAMDERRGPELQFD